MRHTPRDSIPLHDYATSPPTTPTKTRSSARNSPNIALPHDNDTLLQSDEASTAANTITAASEEAPEDKPATPSLVAMEQEEEHENQVMFLFFFWANT